MYKNAITIVFESCIDGIAIFENSMYGRNMHKEERYGFVHIMTSHLRAVMNLAKNIMNVSILWAYKNGLGSQKLSK